MKLQKIIAILSLVLVYSLSFYDTANARYVRKSESFAFLVDNSEGMHGRSDIFGRDKMQAVKAVMSLINSKIPNLGYSATLQLFSPNKTILDYDKWNEHLYSNGIESIQPMSRLKAKNADLASALKEFSRTYHDMGTINVILFADGKGYKEEDYTMVNRLYGSHKGLCLHIISFAENEKDQAKLDIIAKKNPCSVTMHAEDLLKYDNLIEKFIREVLVTETNFRQ